MAQIIYLIGSRGSGKTTIGRLLAKRIGCSFVDTDQELVKQQGKTIAEIIEQSGWQYFRECESEILKQVSKENHVIGTGGGMILAEQNRAFMKSTGTVIFLSAPVSLLSKRLSFDPNNAQRPSLTGQSIHDEVANVLKERLPLYLDSAHHVVDVDRKKEAIVQEILSLLG